MRFTPTVFRWRKRGYQLLGDVFQFIGAELMSKRYTQTEKEYMAEMAIDIIVKLNGEYPSFKNYVWAAQHLLNGGTPNNRVDE